ncbi:MAG TPA: hypothetical protein VMU88_04070, partial [bacterium]|nr:hypothetical protein [bacterium]
GSSSVTIAWAYPEIFYNNGNSSAYLQLQVNDSPVTDAAVSLSGNFPGAPVTLAYASPVTHSGNVYASYQVLGFSYVAGDTYIFTSTALGKTASATLSAPGNLTLSADANGAVTLVNAGIPGSDNSISVYDSSGVTNTLYLSNATFPVTIDASTAYAGISGTIFNLAVNAENDGGTAHNAGVSYGDFEVAAEASRSVTLP